MDKYIKDLANTAVNNAVSSALSQFEIVKPKRKDFWLLAFYGMADGTPLNCDFDFNKLIGKYITIKSIKIYFYAVGQSAIEFMTETGVPPPLEKVVADGQRMLMQSEVFASDILYNLSVNGTAVIFDGNQSDGYIFDLDMDLIDQKIAEKFSSITMNALGVVLSDPTVAPITTIAPGIKVLIQLWASDGK